MLIKIVLSYKHSNIILYRGKASDLHPLVTNSCIKVNVCSSNIYVQELVRTWPKLQSELSFLSPARVPLCVKPHTADDNDPKWNTESDSPLVSAAGARSRRQTRTEPCSLRLVGVVPLFVHPSVHSSIRQQVAHGTPDNVTREEQNKTNVSNRSETKKWAK